MEARRKANASRVKLKLEALLSKGSYYEAQQLYKTLWYRAVGRGQPDAAQLVCEGAIKLLQAGSFNAGGELGQLLVETWRKEGEAPMAPRLEAMLAVNAAFPATAADAARINKELDASATSLPARVVEPQLAYLKAALKWSVEQGPNPHGHPALHLAAARVYTAAGTDPARAQYHYCRSRAPAEHAVALQAWARQGRPSERHLFVTRCILQYLCVEDMASAHAVLRAVTGAPAQPLENFCEFLLEACQYDDAAVVFRTLRSKYALALQQDPSLSALLDKVGRLYFGVQAPVGLLESLFSMGK